MDKNRYSNSLFFKMALSFLKDYSQLWNNLSRLTNVLIILNISLFFLTELVTVQGYYFTFYSLFCLSMVHVLLLIPLGLLNRLWYYLIALFLEGIGAYFLVTSIWYWVVTSRA
jgi:hypothetical protein